MSKINSVLLARILIGVSFFFAALIPVCFIHGFPLPILEHTFLRIKSLRRLFEIFFILFALGLATHPQRKESFQKMGRALEGLATFPGAIWILSGTYFFLFLWQQVSKVFALEINFLPFLFYDYMLWFFDHAKFCFTGYLHGYYHLNVIMLLFYPLWKLWPSPWLLHIADPLIVALAPVPLYYWARQRTGQSVFALAVAFIYLNFRYVENLLEMNFSVEVFYPVLIFSAVYFASIRKNVLYYLSVFLGLLVKEDAAIYFAILGFFYLFSKTDRVRGVWTLMLSVLYPLFLIKVFVPWSGSDILGRDLGNYPRLGGTWKAAVWNLVRHPWLLLYELFFPFEKIRTLLKLTSKLIFIPWLSPWSIPLVFSILPLFFQSTGRGDYFFQLSFYYVAAVLPFLFLAFVDGWQRLSSWSFVRNRIFILQGGLALLVFLNALNLRPLHFTRDDLKTIQLAKTIPADKVVLTQGHLLPYVGYRKMNFYLFPGYAGSEEVGQDYNHPDYFFFDFHANAYPNTPEYVKQTGEALKRDPRYRILYEDHRRLLLEKKA